MIPVEQCRGCRDDFYNGPDRRCWSAPKGEMMIRYAIHYLQVPTAPGAFTKERRPSCYHQVNQRVFFNELPDFVRPEHLNRARRSQSR